MTDEDFEEDLDLGEDLDIEVSDPEFSQGEADAGKPIADADTPNEELDEDELARYDERVQKRIKRAHALAHEERRAKELALQEKEELRRVAQDAYNKMIAERDQRLTYARAAVVAARANLQGQVQLLTQEVRDAMESGDQENQILAQTKLNAVVQQLNQIPSDEALDYDIKRTRETPVSAPALAPAPADDVQSWIQENPWFNQDEKLRTLAIQAEQQLVEQFGMRPGAKDTLDRVSTMIRSSFPDLVGEPVKKQASPPPPPPPAAKPKVTNQGMPVIRSAPGNKKVVRLTAAQVNIAHELGIPVEAYAKEFAKIMNSEG